MSLGSAYKAVTLFVKCNILCVFKNAPETTVRKYFQRCFGEVLAKTGRGRQVVVGNKAGFWVMHAKIIFLSSHYLAFNLTGLEKGLVF